MNTHALYPKVSLTSLVVKPSLRESKRSFPVTSASVKTTFQHSMVCWILLGLYYHRCYCPYSPVPVPPWRVAECVINIKTWGSRRLMPPSTLTAIWLLTEASTSRFPSELHQACMTGNTGSNRLCSPGQCGPPASSKQLCHPCSSERWPTKATTLLALDRSPTFPCEDLSQESLTHTGV